MHGHRDPIVLQSGGREESLLRRPNPSTPLHILTSSLVGGRARPRQGERMSAIRVAFSAAHCQLSGVAPAGHCQLAGMALAVLSGSRRPGQACACVVHCQLSGVEPAGHCQLSGMAQAVLSRAQPGQACAMRRQTRSKISAPPSDLRYKYMLPAYEQTLAAYV